MTAVDIALGVSSLLEGMAFDEAGGLWLDGGVGQLVRLAPAQLTTSTTLGDPTVPATILESPDVRYATGIAVYPAPADLPLLHALP